MGSNQGTGSGLDSYHARELSRAVTSAEQSTHYSRTYITLGVVRLLQSLDGALDINRQLQHPPSRLVQPVLVKLKHVHFLLSRAPGLPIVPLTQARVFFDLEHRAQSLHIGKELSSRFVRFHVNFFSFYLVIFLVIPNLQRHLFVRSF